MIAIQEEKSICEKICKVILQHKGGITVKELKKHDDIQSLAVNVFEYCWEKVKGSGYIEHVEGTFAKGTKWIVTDKELKWDSEGKLMADNKNEKKHKEDPIEIRKKELRTLKEALSTANLSELEKNFGQMIVDAKRKFIDENRSRNGWDSLPRSTKREFTILIENYAQHYLQQIKSNTKKSIYGCFLPLKPPFFGKKEDVPRFMIDYYKQRQENVPQEQAWKNMEIAGDDPQDKNTKDDFFQELKELSPEQQKEMREYAKRFKQSK